MASIAQAKSLLETIEGLTVFSDGYFYDGTGGDRTANKLPFCQIITDVLDSSSHVGGGQTSNITIKGRVCLRKKIDSASEIINNIESAFKSNNLFELRINSPNSYSSSLDVIDFNLDTFRTLVG